MANPSMSNNNSTQSIIPSATTASGDGGRDSTSPQSRARSLPSLWAQVVRGEPEPSPSLPAIAAPASSSLPPSAATAPAALPEQGSYSASSSDSSGATAQAESSVDNGGNAVPPRRCAWSRPSNGVVEPVTVMGGAVSWPALSESTRSGPRSTQDSTRPISNGSSSASQVPIVNQSPQRQVSATANVNASANPNSNANHRQRSIKHRVGSGGGGGGYSNSHNGGASAHGGFNRPPPPPPSTPLPPPFPVVEIPPYGNMVPPTVVMDSSVGGPRPRHHLHGVMNSHSSQRNSSRRGHYGPRPRADGSYHNHNNHGGRRDQERRDGHMQQFVHPPQAFMPPPPPVTPPYGPLSMRPFPGTMGFGDMASPLIYVPTYPPEPYRGVPLIAQAPPPPPPMLYPLVEPPLPVKIVNQIDYYFSDVNLATDGFLRCNMDDEGWVLISLIVTFPRVASLTSNIEFIAECLKASQIVDVQDNKVRRRDDWRRWIQTPRHNGDSASHSTAKLINNVLVNSVQNVTLDDATSSKHSTSDAAVVDAQVDTDPSIRASELANGDGTAEAVSSS